MKKQPPVSMEDTIKFEIELGLRPDYSQLEKKLIAENSELTQKLSQYSELLQTEQLRQVEEIKNFANALRKELETLINESPLPAAKKEHLMQKVAVLSKHKLETTVLDIFSYLEIK